MPSVRVYKEAIISFLYTLAAGRFYKWSVPGGIVSMQTFSKHITHYLHTYNAYRSVYDLSWNIPYSLWSEKWRRWFSLTIWKSNLRF